MGAKMKHVCMSYGAAKELLGGKAAIELGHNTMLRDISWKGFKAIAVRLHQTDVVIFHEDGTVELNSGGYETVTTKDRINKFSPMGIYQQQGDWYMHNGEKTPFRDGIKIKDGVVIQ